MISNPRGCANIQKDMGSSWGEPWVELGVSLTLKIYFILFRVK
jgi:hypothetical protein